MTIETIIARLDEPAAILWNSVSAAALVAAAAETRVIVRAIDEAAAETSARRTQALAALTAPRHQPGRPQPIRKPIDQVIEMLGAIEEESRQLALLRETAASLAAQIDARAREAGAAEAARDAARKLFEDQARRAADHAKQAANWPTLAGRVVTLFRTDVVLARLGVSAYSRTPRPRGSHFAYEVTFDVPRAIATEEVLRATKLPGFWPPPYSDFSPLVLQNWRLSDEDDGVDARIVGPLRDLCRRNAPVSQEEVDSAILRAQSGLVVEFNKVLAAIRALLRLDGEITAADRDARYPDGALIFDPAMFPQNLEAGRMNRRIALPSTGGLALAAE